jgi:hypothetical protein
MLQTTSTANLTESAPAASVPCPRMFVVDGCSAGFASTLAERCVR